MTQLGEINYQKVANLGSDTEHTVNYNDGIAETIWNHNSSFRPFEILKPATMVIITFLNGEVSLKELFIFLPIDYPSGTKVNNPENNSVMYGTGYEQRLQNVNQIFCNIPPINGNVTSLRFDNQTRGKANGGFWPFAIMMDIFIDGRYINARLTKSKIHMAGVKSEHMACNLAELLCERITKVRDAFAWLKSFKESETLTKVKIFEAIYRAIIDCGTLVDAYFRPIEYYIKSIEDELKFHIQKSEKANYVNLISLLISYLIDYLYCDDQIGIGMWIGKVQYMLTFVDNQISIVSPELYPNFLYKANINYDFSLGFGINAKQFVRVISAIDGFIVVFHNAISPSIRITVCYEFPEELRKYIEKRDNRTRITMIIQVHGHVAFTGPCQELMKQVYDKFMHAVHTHRREIEVVRPMRKTLIESSLPEDPVLSYQRMIMFRRHQLNGFIVKISEIHCNCKDNHIPINIKLPPIMGCPGWYPRREGDVIEKITKFLESSDKSSGSSNSSLKSLSAGNISSSEDEDLNN